MWVSSSESPRNLSAAELCGRLACLAELPSPGLSVPAVVAASSTIPSQPARSDPHPTPPAPQVPLQAYESTARAAARAAPAHAINPAQSYANRTRPALLVRITSVVTQAYSWFLWMETRWPLRYPIGEGDQICPNTTGHNVY